MTNNGKLKEAAAHGHPPPNVRLYLAIFGTLLCLTVLTVVVSYWHLPPGPAIFVGLLIACIKAGLVLAFFMHLKGEHKLIYACLGITAFCLIGFTLAPLDQHLLRDRATHTDVAKQAGDTGAPEGSVQELNSPSPETQKEGEQAKEKAAPAPDKPAGSKAKPGKAAPKKTAAGKKK